MNSSVNNIIESNYCNNCGSKKKNVTNNLSNYYFNLNILCSFCKSNKKKYCSECGCENHNNTNRELCNNCLKEVFESYINGC